MKRIILIFIVLLMLLSLLLSACGPIDNSNGNSNRDTAKDSEDNDQAGNADKVTICHKTGSAKNPYVEITVSADAATEGHGTHEGDLIPAPEAGCPTTIANPDVPAR